MDSEKLTPQQRELVERNIGLVGVHLRRCVSSPPHPTRRCEREDLFQEGCLALVRAAGEYDPRRHGSFPGFALNRIHAAISQALYEKFTVVHVPYQVARGRRRDPRQPSRPAGMLRPADESRKRPVAVMAEDFDLSLLAARPPSGATGGRTLGDCVRELVESAIRETAETLAAKSRGRGDRAEMIDAVLGDRLLVPEVDQRKPLRRLARELRCSVSRVVSCEQAILRLVRGRLGGDAVYRLLVKMAAEADAGFATPLTQRDEQGLGRALRQQFEDGFGQQHPEEQGAMLVRLADRVSGGAKRLAGQLYAMLPADEQRDLSHVLWPPGTRHRRRDKAS